jgi:uroporphyrinogen decarboxylase
MLDLMTEDPNVIHDVIDYCREACVAFAKAQKDAGADVTSIGDALAGPNLISPEMYNEFAWEPEKKMSREVQDYGIPLSIHICGDTSTIIEGMAATGARILEIDWQVDMGEARKKIPADRILMGNINPSDPMVFGTKEKVEESVKEIIHKTRGKNIFISTGCAMGRNTPPENFRKMIETVHEYGTREMLESL